MPITPNNRPEKTSQSATYAATGATQTAITRDSPVSVSPVIAEVFTHLHSEASSKNIMLVNNTFQQVHVPISKTIVHFMIMALVDNSIKYSENGRVDVSCERDKDLLSVQVNDAGKGMDRRQIEQIMQSTAPVPTVTNREAGSDKGLRQVNELLQQLNGSMIINSIPGKGTTVRLDIPLSAA